MQKRFIVGIVITLIVAVPVVFYFINEKEPVADSLYRAVPLDAALMVEIKSFDEFYGTLIDKNPLWEEISGLPLFTKLKDELNLLDTLRKSNSTLHQLLSQKQPLLISGHPTGKDDIQLVYYFRFTSDKDFKHLQSLLQNSKGRMVEQASRRYEQAEIHDVSFPEQKADNFSYTHCNGIIMLSQSAILLEDAVRQLHETESVINKTELGEAMKTAGKKSLLNIYLDLEQFPRLALKLIHPKYRKNLDGIKNFGKWVELDLNPKPGILIFNGFSLAKHDKPSIESLFKNQSPIKLDIFNKIPSSANTLVAMGISDFEAFCKDYGLYQEVHGNFAAYRSGLENLKTNFNIDLLDAMNAQFDHEVGNVFFGENPDSIELQSFSLLKVKNKDDAHKMLFDFVSEYAAKNNIKPASLTADTKIGDETFTFYTLPFANIPAMLFGDLFSTGSNSVCCVYNNYIVFGSGPNELAAYMATVLSGNTLGSDADFLGFSEYLSSQTNFFFYNKPAFSKGFYSNFLKKDMIGLLEKHQSNFDKLNSVVYQFNMSNNNLIYNNIFVKYSMRPTAPVTVVTAAPEMQSSAPEQVTTGTQPAIKVPLDGVPVIKPVFIKGGSDPEIFVQDDKNIAYFIDKTGKILWKKKLNDKIISDISVIDYYKNGKLQLLFNTKSQLLLIDKKGNFVEKYPVNFPSGATCGLSVFDYDNNREYRIFVALKNKRILALDKDGQPINGWDFEKTRSEVVQPLQHFRIQGKDFLAFADQDQIYLTDRKGQLQTTTNQKLNLSENNKISLINSKSLNDARFLCTNADGKVIQIAIDGKIETLDFGKFPENHFFDANDINADGAKEFIFTFNNQVKIFNQQKKPITTITVQKPISFRPSFYEFSSNTCKIGITTSNDNTICLYTGSGKTDTGFPLRGATQFSIKLSNNSENKLNLIVGSNTNFLYLYRVQ